MSKLTSWEWDAIVSEYNLTDGHAHQEQNTLQIDLIGRLPAIYLSASTRDQNTIQCEFEKVFFSLAGQDSYASLPPPQYHYSCSMAIEVVGNYLRKKNLSVSLLHPTFDNLADILKRHLVPLSSLEEDGLVELIDGTRKVGTDALFLVCPNNPTGTEITKDRFNKLVNYCKVNRKLLILDFSFRFYSDFLNWDQYKILYESGIDFIILEDTGKTWPTLDLKLGILLSSQSLHDCLRDITNDFLLNVSPFIFLLLTEYLRLEKNRNLSFVQAVNKNRDYLIGALANSPLVLMSTNSKLSVAWLKLPDGVKSAMFCKKLKKQKIYVLPGVPFFWNDPKRGESFIRVALARPHEFFKIAVSRFLEVANTYQD